MNTRHLLTLAACCGVLGVSNLGAAPDPNFHCYLCFGQSNMAGGCNGGTATAESIDNQPADCDTTPRIKVMAWFDCPNSAQTNTNSNPCKKFALKRTNNKWYTAFPPYNKCDEGIGPAVYFGKTILDSVKENTTIGIIHAAVSGVGIEVFMKGSGTSVTNGQSPPGITTNIYGWMLKKCQIAQETGVIKGIIFHQGENNASEGDAWATKVKQIFNDLKADLKLSDSIPIVVGEMLRGACCEGLNTTIDKLAKEYPHCALASSEGLKKRLGDSYNAHFDCVGMRELGRRFAKGYLSLAKNDWEQRKGTVDVLPPAKAIVSASTVRSWTGAVKIFSLDGKTVSVLNLSRDFSAWRAMKPGNIYLVSKKPSSDTKLMIIPSAK
jgi:hypothetical protein